MTTLGIAGENSTGPRRQRRAEEQPGRLLDVRRRIGPRRREDVKQGGLKAVDAVLEV